jgi:hypothetical protein
MSDLAGLPEAMERMRELVVSFKIDAEVERGLEATYRPFVEQMLARKELERNRRMIRIIVQTDDAGMAVNIGGAVKRELKTFDLNIPDLEAYLQEASHWTPGYYCQRQVIGVEVVKGTSDV